MISGFLPLILLYPETHYRFKHLPFSKYFAREPEIIIDMPYKSLSGRFPVFLIIKDAHLFPVLIWEVRFRIQFEDGSSFVKTFVLQKKFDTMLDFEIFEFDFDDKRGYASVNAEIRYYAESRLRTVFNDNLKGIDSELEIYLNDDEELFDNYIQGDLHYHSEFTSDQVEFGAPLELTRMCAQYLGIGFFGVTDHSYDLDDLQDNYLKKDPDLKKFKNMRTSCEELSDESVALIPGEEITVRNKLNRNVHLLVYDSVFFEGSGDSAEKWFSTKSENSIGEVVSSAGEAPLIIAAHPFNKTPLLEYLLVKRGVWSEDDITDNNIRYIQILNGEYDENFFKSMMIWVKLLLAGHRIFITAGNDAHGNFNIFRQVKIPMFSLISDHRQIFGKCRTAVCSGSREKNDVISAVRSGNMYITDGPHLLFSVTDGADVYDTGSEFKAKSDTLNIEFFVNSSSYSGPVKGILIYRGSINAFDEKIIYEKQFTETLYSYNETVPIVNDKIDHYIRIEVFTSVTYSNGRHSEHRAYSNPVWIRK